jgi:hypothetical protein
MSELKQANDGLQAKCTELRVELETKHLEPSTAQAAQSAAKELSRTCQQLQLKSEEVEELSSQLQAKDQELAASRSALQVYSRPRANYRPLCIFLPVQLQAATVLMRESTGPTSWLNVEYARCVCFLRERGAHRLFAAFQGWIHPILSSRAHLRSIFCIVILFAAFRLRMLRNRRGT